MPAWRRTDIRTQAFRAVNQAFCAVLAQEILLESRNMARSAQQAAACSGQGSGQAAPNSAVGVASEAEVDAWVLRTTVWIHDYHLVLLPQMLTHAFVRRWQNSAAPTKADASAQLLQQARRCTSCLF